MITNTTATAATAQPMAIVLPVPIVFEVGRPALAVYSVSAIGGAGEVSALGVLSPDEGVGAGVGSGAGLLACGAGASLCGVFCGAEKESLPDEDESLEGVESEPE